MHRRQRFIKFSFQCASPFIASVSRSCSAPNGVFSVKDKVLIVGTKKDLRAGNRPTFDWLNVSTSKYFRHLASPHRSLRSTNTLYLKRLTIQTCRTARATTGWPTLISFATENSNSSRIATCTEQQTNNVLLQPPQRSHLPRPTRFHQHHHD